MSDRHPVRNGIIASTVGGLLVALILAIAGKLPLVLDWLWARLNEASDAITRPVPVPAWIVGVCVVGAIFGIRYSIRIRGVTAGEVSPRTTTSSQLAIGGVQLPDPNSLDMRIIQQLVRADGTTVELRSLGYQTGAPMLKIHQAVERLHETGIVEIHRNYVHGPSISFTRAGRDAAIGS